MLKKNKPAADILLPGQSVRQSVQKKKSVNLKIKKTESTVNETKKNTVNEPVSGGPISLQNSEQKSTESYVNGRQLAKLLSSKEACEILGCHYQTLLYREQQGQIKSRTKVGTTKYWNKADVLLLKHRRPVKPKPHYTKRIAQQTQQPKQSLWKRFLNFLTASVAR